MARAKLIQGSGDLSRSYILSCAIHRPQGSLVYSGSCIDGGVAPVCRPGGSIIPEFYYKRMYDSARRLPGLVVCAEPTRLQEHVTAFGVGQPEENRRHHGARHPRQRFFPSPVPFLGVGIQLVDFKDRMAAGLFEGRDDVAIVVADEILAPIPAASGTKSTPTRQARQGCTSAAIWAAWSRAYRSRAQARHHERNQKLNPPSGPGSGQVSVRRFRTSIKGHALTVTLEDRRPRPAGASAIEHALDGLGSSRRRPVRQGKVF